MQVASEFSEGLSAGTEGTEGPAPGLRGSFPVGVGFL